MLYKRQAILGHRNTTPNWTSVLLPEKCPGIKILQMFFCVFYFPLRAFKFFLLRADFQLLFLNFF